MERLHPVALKEEVAINVKITAFVSIDFNAKILENFRSVEPLSDVTELLITEISAIFTFATDVVDILSCPLVWSQESIIAVY